MAEESNGTSKTLLAQENMYDDDTYKCPVCENTFHTDFETYDTKGDVAAHILCIETPKTNYQNNYNKMHSAPWCRSQTQQIDEIYKTKQVE